MYREYKYKNGTVSLVGINLYFHWIINLLGGCAVNFFFSILLFYSLFSSGCKKKKKKKENSFPQRIFRKLHLRNDYRGWGSLVVTSASSFRSNSITSRCSRGESLGCVLLSPASLPRLKNIKPVYGGKREHRSRNKGWKNSPLNVSSRLPS